jgi:hypothetical protein
MTSPIRRSDTDITGGPVRSYVVCECGATAKDHHEGRCLFLPAGSQFKSEFETKYANSFHIPHDDAMAYQLYWEAVGAKFL